ncbi:MULTISPECIES: hypothetical protein [Haloarcula]|uniref:hypothetical protein n=1 Tax=Haloarcula TaxID=2237 RepID=UPI0023ECEDBA|nr:hypothetical protein [Halomicroarcula sp. XH51]
MDTKLFALISTVGLLLFAFGPGAATAMAATGNDTTAGTDATTAGNDGVVVSVAQAGNDGATVTVTDDGEPVEGADVTVEATDGNIYIGEGDYTTGEDGTVDLPEPNFDVEVEVTATTDSGTASTTTTLTTEADQSFGMSVSGFVHDLLGQSGLEGGIGFQVATFATQNNPGNAPDHAGPPEDKANAQGEQGPPEDRGNDEAKTQGPPEDTGPDAADDETVESEDVETDEEETETEDAETEDGEAETDDAETEDDDDDGESGPPDHANGNGR